MQGLNTKIFVPSHYPKEGLDPIPVLGNLCRERLCSDQLAHLCQRCVCDGAESRGGWGDQFCAGLIQCTGAISIYTA